MFIPKTILQTFIILLRIGGTVFYLDRKSKFVLLFFRPPPPDWTSYAAHRCISPVARCYTPEIVKRGKFSHIICYFSDHWNLVFTLCWSWHLCLLLFHVLFCTFNNSFILPKMPVAVVIPEASESCDQRYNNFLLLTLIFKIILVFHTQFFNNNLF